MSWFVALPQSLIDRINAQLNTCARVRRRYTYFGVDGGYPRWWFDGMTPVSYSVVVQELEAAGANMALVMRDIQTVVRRVKRKEDARLQLVASAKAKLTPAEIKACRI